MDSRPGSRPQAPHYYNVLNNNSGNKNVRSITYAHEIQKDFTEDIVAKQGLNALSFPDR